MRGNNINLIKSFIMGDKSLVSLVINGGAREAIDKAQEKTGVVLSKTQRNILLSILEDSVARDELNAEYLSF